MWEHQTQYLLAVVSMVKRFTAENLLYGEICTSHLKYDNFYDKSVNIQKYCVNKHSCLDAAAVGTKLRNLDSIPGSGKKCSPQRPGEFIRSPVQ
jgi:hypothetical protein